MTQTASPRHSPYVELLTFFLLCFTPKRRCEKSWRRVYYREALPRVEGLIHPRPEKVLYSCLVLWNHRERSERFASLQHQKDVIGTTDHH